jgi:hypothetical protein
MRLIPRYRCLGSPPAQMRPRQPPPQLQHDRMRDQSYEHVLTPRDLPEDGLEWARIIL